MRDKKPSHWLPDGEQFHHMFDQSPAFIALLHGPDHIFEMTNKAYMALLPGRDVIGKAIREVMPEVEGQGYIQLLDHAYTTGEAFTGFGMPVILNDSDGTTRQLYVDFVYQPVRDEEGKVISILVQGSDITVRKLAEDQLRESEEKYRLLFQSIDQGYCVVKVRTTPGEPLDYQFIEINAAFEQQTGLKGAQGKWMRELQPQHEEFWFETYRDIVVTGQPVRFEHEAKGMRRWFSVYAFRIGRPEETQVAILFSDITQRVKDEIALNKAHNELEIKVLERTAELAQSNQELAEAKWIAERASQAKSDILSNTSHELRTPLNSLLLISQLLAENPESNFTERQRKYINVITESGQDLLTLVNDLLDMAQIESGVSFSLKRNRVSWQHMHDCLVGGFGEMALKKKLDFKITLAPELPADFVTDERRLLQVLKNLLTNAFKFTSQGSISLDIRVALADSVDAYLLGEALTAIEFTVSDTGIGIGEEKLQVIFEAFRQAETGNARHYGGTGLGLTISRALVQMLGGTINVQSQPGKGSVFKVILPSEPFTVIAAPQKYGQSILT